MRGVGDDAHVEEERLLKELPHVVGCVDLLHLDLGVDVAVIQEVDVCVLHLGYRVGVAHLRKKHFPLRALEHGLSVPKFPYHVDDVIEGQQRMALDFCVDVLAHRAARQKPNQLDVVPNT